MILAISSCFLVELSGAVDSCTLCSTRFNSLFHAGSFCSATYDVVRESTDSDDMVFVLGGRLESMLPSGWQF